MRPLFTYIANTGLRVGSALATEVDWIDFAAHVVRYPKRVMKNRKPHVIELNPEAEQALHDELATSPHKPFDFSYWYALKRWHVAREAAGFPTFRIHDLRHSYITALLDSGVAIHVVRDIAAHRDLHVTQHYAHSSDDARRRAAAKVRIAAPRDANKGRLVPPRDTNGGTSHPRHPGGDPAVFEVHLEDLESENSKARAALRSAGPRCSSSDELVPGAGIEPATRGFSVPCSTD